MILNTFHGSCFCAAAWETDTCFDKGDISQSVWDQSLGVSMCLFVSLHSEMPHSKSRPRPKILFTSPEWSLCTLTNEKPAPSLVPEELVAQPDSDLAHTHQMERNMLTQMICQTSKDEPEREREIMHVYWVCLSQHAFFLAPVIVQQGLWSLKHLYAQSIQISMEF